jgi:hypothetical protein
MAEARSPEGGHEVGRLGPVIAEHEAGEQGSLGG